MLTKIMRTRQAASRGPDPSLTEEHPHRLAEAFAGMRIWRQPSLIGSSSEDASSTSMDPPDGPVT
jgi:hypothetical protein